MVVAFYNNVKHIAYDRACTTSNSVKAATRLCSPTGPSPSNAHCAARRTASVTTPRNVMAKTTKSHTSVTYVSAAGLAVSVNKVKVYTGDVTSDNHGIYSVVTTRTSLLH